MDFKNIFSNIVGSNKNIVEVPGIIIDDYELIGILGYWMGLISYDDFEKMKFYKGNANIKKYLLKSMILIVFVIVLEIYYLILVYLQMKYVLLVNIIETVNLLTVIW